MEPSVQIRLVRENLALALALWEAAQQGIISAGFVSRKASANSPGCDNGRISASLEVHDTKDLVRCVNNQIRGAFAFSAIQANRAMESVYGNSPVRDTESEIQAARCVLYLLSQTVNNDLMTPVWDCPPEYRRTFKIPSASFTLDASALNGKKVFWDDFGGLPKYLDLLEFCSDHTSMQPQSPQRTVEPASALSEKETEEPRWNPSEESIIDSVSLDSISSFVEARCLVGKRELILAKELFDAYLHWCNAEGYQPHSQRGFGMKLSNLGFERRRRGKGKHWWMGLSLTESPVTASGIAD